MAIVRPLEPFPNLPKYDWSQPEVIAWFHQLAFIVEDLVDASGAGPIGPPGTTLTFDSSQSGASIESEGFDGVPSGTFPDPFVLSLKSQVGSINFPSSILGVFGEESEQYSAVGSSEGQFGSGILGSTLSKEVVLYTVTTNATITELFIDGPVGSQRLSIPNDTTWAFQVHIVARRTDANNESAEYLRKGAIDNNAGTTSLVAAVQTLGTDIEDTAAWDITVDADDTNDTLRIQATGEAAKTIRWVAHVRIVESNG